MALRAHHCRLAAFPVLIALVAASAVSAQDVTPEPSDPQPILPARTTVTTRQVEGMPVLLARGLRVGLECPSACTATTTIQIGRKGARRIGIAAAAVSLGEATARIPGGGELTYPVKVHPTTRPMLRNAGRLAVVLHTKVVRTGAATTTIDRHVTLVPRTPANRKPVFAAGRRTTVTTSVTYDGTGALMGGETTITLATPAKDPDGDPVAYTWSSSTGTVVAAGRRVAWLRDADAGALAGGTVTLTVSDGRGGKAVANFAFARGAQ